MKTLIIYEFVPDETRLYLVPTADLPEMLTKCLVVAQGTYMNSEGLTDPQEKAHALIDISMVEKEAPDIAKQLTEQVIAAGWSPDQVPPVFSFLAQYRVKPINLPTQCAEIDAVFHLGFLL